MKPEINWNSPSCLCRTIKRKITGILRSGKELPRTTHAAKAGRMILVAKNHESLYHMPMFAGSIPFDKSLTDPWKDKRITAVYRFSATVSC